MYPVSRIRNETKRIFVQLRVVLLISIFPNKLREVPSFIKQLSSKRPRGSPGVWGEGGRGGGGGEYKIYINISPNLFVFPPICIYIESRASFWAVFRFLVVLFQLDVIVMMDHLSDL